MSEAIHIHSVGVGKCMEFAALHELRESRISVRDLLKFVPNLLANFPRNFLHTLFGLLIDLELPMERESLLFQHLDLVDEEREMSIDET